MLNYVIDYKTKNSVWTVNCNAAVQHVYEHCIKIDIPRTLIKNIIET